MCSLKYLKNSSGVRSNFDVQISLGGMGELVWVELFLLIFVVAQGQGSISRVSGCALVQSLHRFKDLLIFV